MCRCVEPFVDNLLSAVLAFSSFASDRGAKYLRPACLHVRLSVRSHISKATRLNFTKFSVHVTWAVARLSSDGSANSKRYLLPLAWMTSCFHMMERIGHKQRRRVRFVYFASWRHQLDARQRCLVEFVAWRHRGRSLLSPTGSCYYREHYFRYIGTSGLMAAQRQHL